MVQELRRLDPRPCAEFGAVEPETLVPDILLRRTSWGGWHLELNPDTLPRVLLDRNYAAEIGARDCAETRRYLGDCLASANWLIRSLDQRARTILKIATEIVRRQQRFLDEGIAGLRPLNLRTVAEAVGMHESTASRVTSNKYIATERGIFELKFFFTNAVGGETGGVAAESVRHRIRAMVDGEPPAAVLSDDEIVERLRSRGHRHRAKDGRQVPKVAEHTVFDRATAAEVAARSVVSLRPRTRHVRSAPTHSVDLGRPPAQS